MIIIDFYEKVDYIAKQVMKCLGDEILHTLDSNAISHENIDVTSENYGFDAYLLWANCLGKRVEIKPRKVSISTQLKEKMADSSFAEETALIEYFASQIESSKDINGHLSTGIYKAEKWDFLLNQWNIRHLHLSKLSAVNKIEMRSNRSDKLLFFITTETEACFLDVRQHPKGSGFTSQSFLRIAEENGWMSLCGGYCNEDIIPGTLQPRDLSDEQIYKCYKNNINLTLEVNGRYYSFMGTTRFGNKFVDTLSAQDLFRRITEAIEQELRSSRKMRGVKIDLGNGYIILQTDPMEQNPNKIWL